MTILISGANGFVGSRLVPYLQERGLDLRLAIRRPGSTPLQAPALIVGDIDGQTNWQLALRGVDTVIHLAARAHHMEDTEAQAPLYSMVNHEGTLNLANAAQAAGVRRFIYLSSIKVFGEYTLPGYPWKADYSPAPQGPYAQSKYAAEEGLRRIEGMEIVIVRPTLIYGPGVKGNMLQLIRLIDRCPILPFGALTAHRSLIAVDNLADLLFHCIYHPDAPALPWLVEDNPGQSTAHLFRMIAKALGKSRYLLPIPTVLLEQGAALLRRKEMMQRLTRSLAVDMRATTEILGWTPPMRNATAIEQMITWYRQHLRA